MAIFVDIFSTVSVYPVVDSDITLLIYRYVASLAHLMNFPLPSLVSATSSTQLRSSCHENECFGHRRRHCAISLYTSSAIASYISTKGLTLDSLRGAATQNEFCIIW